jgi:hypothetical protein
MRHIVKAAKRLSWWALVLAVAGLAGGCGGFSGSIPISSWMFMQNSPTGESTAPASELVSTNAVPDIAWMK